MALEALIGSPFSVLQLSVLGTSPSDVQAAGPPPCKRPLSDHARPDFYPQAVLMNCSQWVYIVITPRAAQSRWRAGYPLV